MPIVSIDNDLLFGDVCRLLAEGREVIIPTKGWSMLPFIRGCKDTVALRKMDGYSVGDIVLFRYQGRFILHRVIEIGPERAVMMGDGNLGASEACRREDIEGKAVMIYRNGTRAVNPDSGWNRLRARCWRRLRPVRRYLLGIYRRLPWNRAMFRAYA